MKMRVRFALVGCLLSVGAHLYLALDYYPLKAGFVTGQSLCTLNSKFDCRAVSASAYASFLGLPLSIWGAVTNAVLFGLILMSWLEWSEHPERLRRWTLALAGVSVGASVVMGGISSLLMSTYCLFCITLYALSFLTFFCFRKVLREPFWANIKHDFPHLWAESRGVLISWVSIPVLALLLHQIFMQNLGLAEIGNMVKESIQEWEVSPKVEFVAKPSLSMGPANAVLTLVEFADFRCGHCKRASYTLHAFVNANPDVRFEFYSFPLDSSCNDKIEGAGGGGISCRLAAAVYCAEKSGKGWEAHDALFNVQDEVNRLQTMAEVDMVMSKQMPSIGLNWESLQTCIADTTTTEAIKAQAKQGSLANVRGTPTLFANGKLINRVMLPVLQEARAKSLAHK